MLVDKFKGGFEGEVWSMSGSLLVGMVLREAMRG
jgi:hypothetical protein